MVIGDVGLGESEELDFVPAGTSGRNFGWPCFEGAAAFDASARYDGAVAPILDRPHGPGDCSIIAGVVVRDPRLPALAGRFLFGDYCTGVVEAHDRGREGRRPDVARRDRAPSCRASASDGLGRVYLTSTAGPVYRLDPA